MEEGRIVTCGIEMLDKLCCAEMTASALIQRIRVSLAVSTAAMSHFPVMKLGGHPQLGMVFLNREYRVNLMAPIQSVSIQR